VKCPMMPGCVRLCPLRGGGKEHKYTSDRGAAEPLIAAASEMERAGWSGNPGSFQRVCMGLFRRSPMVRALVVLGITILVLVLSAILLPPKGSNAMPRNGGGEVPAFSPR
jgi:hypothetical protein